MMNVYTRVIPGDEDKAQLATQSHACVLSGLFIPSVLLIFCDCLKVLLANFFSIILKVVSFSFKSKKVPFHSKLKKVPIEILLF